jgi:hypothetical protein
MSQQINISEAVQKKCEACGGEYFDGVVKLGILSKLAATNKLGQDVLVQYPTFICRKCGIEFGKSNLLVN